MEKAKLSGKGWKDLEMDIKKNFPVSRHLRTFRKVTKN